MKYTNKITASLLAALMITGTAVTAVPDSNASFGINAEAAFSTYSTYAYAPKVAVQIYRSCMRVTWGDIDPTGYFLIKVCREDGSVAAKYRTDADANALICPFSDLQMDTSDDGHFLPTKFYVSVISIYGNAVNEENVVPYIDTATGFTLSPDMSKYEEYGTPQNVKSECTKDSMTLSWTNPAATRVVKDIFTVKVIDRFGNTVAMTETRGNKITINKLLYGNTYTVFITNTTYNASVKLEVTVKPADKNTGSNNSSNNTDSKYKPVESANNKKPSASADEKLNGLTAPKNLKSSVSTKKITLTWSKVSGADAYRVYQYDAKKGAYVRIKTVKSNKCVISDFQPDKTYKFRVCAVKKSKSTGKYLRGPLTAPISVKTGEREVAPTIR